MMNRRVRDSLRGEFVASMGWLFADLLLVLTMLFLASNPWTFQAPTHPSTSGAQTIIAPIPTPTARYLDKTPCEFTLTNLDYKGLLQTPPSPRAIAEGQQKVKAQPCLQQRGGQKAGLVLAFGGAVATNKTTHPTIGTQIASQVNNQILLTLGMQNDFIFTQDTVYNAYHDLGSSYGTVQLKIYLFT